MPTEALENTLTSWSSIDKRPMFELSLITQMPDECVSVFFYWAAVWVNRAEVRISIIIHSQRQMKLLHTIKLLQVPTV